MACVSGVVATRHMIQATLAQRTSVLQEETQLCLSNIREPMRPCAFCPFTSVEIVTRCFRTTPAVRPRGTALQRNCLKQ